MFISLPLIIMYSLIIIKINNKIFLKSFFNLLLSKIIYIFILEIILAFVGMFFGNWHIWLIEGWGREDYLKGFLINSIYYIIVYFSSFFLDNFLYFKNIKKVINEKDYIIIKILFIIFFILNFIITFLLYIFIFYKTVLLVINY